MTHSSESEDDVSTISPVTQDYLKVIWSATEWGGPPVTTKALAHRLGISSAAVSETVKRLSAQGLLEHRPYRPIALTEQGTRHALQMVRRHRLIETFLVTTLDYRPDEVHDEAETLEHWVSESFMARIDALLEHPTHDPHGDAIPAEDGAIPRPARAVSLAAAVAGRYEVIRVSDADTSRLGWFLERGIVPGVVLDVAGWDDHSQTTSIEVLDVQLDAERTLSLAAAAADAVMLTPLA